MIIESLIKRAEGSFVTIGKDIYHFFNHIEGDLRHVAEVTDEDHIQTFLAIKEGYRIAKPIKKAKAPDPAADVAAKAAADKAAQEAAEKEAAAKEAAAKEAAKQAADAAAKGK